MNSDIKNLLVVTLLLLAAACAHQSKLYGCVETNGFHKPCQMGEK